MKRAPMLRPALCALLLFSACQDGPEAEPAQPNVVILLADDLGWNDVGYHGSEIRTPRIDRLAAEGVELDRCYAFPSCSPSRAALLTGRSPFRMGILYSAIRPDSREGLPLGERTIGEYFQGAGYATALIGKWHLGHSVPAQHPNERGFDHFYGFLTGAVDYFQHTRNGGVDWQRNGRTLREGGYSTQLFAREAVRWLKRRDRDCPFLLYMPFNAPHVPLQAPGAAAEPYAHIEDKQRMTYAAMVDVLDGAIGTVLDELEEQGIADETIVLFLSDNGGALPEGSRNAPLRGGKFDLTEGGLRVPAAIRWPDGLAGGRSCEQVVTIMDVLPTLAEAAGVTLAADPPLDGVSRWPQIAGAPAVAPEDLVFGGENTHGLSYAVFDGDWKLVVDLPGAAGSAPSRALYRYMTDPSEGEDLTAQRPEVVQRLEGILEEWLGRVPEDATRWNTPPPPDWEAPEDWAAAMRGGGR